MSYVVNVDQLRERASKRVATLATVATLLPEPVSKVAAVATDAPRSGVGGNALMTAGQADACHSPCWDDAETQVFTERRNRLMRWGWDTKHADDVAERLTLRDRERDDRSMCVECSNLNQHGRCIAASLGRLAGVSRRHEPMTTLLQRCEGFLSTVGSRDRE